MATAKSQLVSYQFEAGGKVVGRATWMGPGMVELDFSDAALRDRFSRWLAHPRTHDGLMFETGAEHDHFFGDEDRHRFAEACAAMSNLYKVRRVG